MRWPWVSRARLETEERLVKLLRATLMEVRVEAKEFREHYFKSVSANRDRVDGLMATITTMRREEGFEPPALPIELDEEDELPSAIWAAINEVSAKGTMDYHVNVAHARSELEAGTPHGEIVERILKGLDIVV
jgi:hypothetical protein